MPTDEALTNLLVLYAGLLVINVVLTAILWSRSRSIHYGMLFTAWMATMVSVVIQGVLVSNDFFLALGFASVFPVNLAFALLLADAADVDLPWRRLTWVLAAAVAVSGALFLVGASFTATGIPVALAVALPSIEAARRTLARWRDMTISVRALAGSCVLFSLHNLDWPFLRDRPEYAALGFTIAILIVFALSVTAPAVVLEQLTEQKARVTAEMDVARSIQNRILPQDARLPGLDIVTHVRPAEAVGGDYFDIYGRDDESWVLLGDVTGHGLGAGLVMLMAQSTIASILRARPGIRPSELNYLANQVLCANLARLGETRHMTVVSICRLADDRFAISGCHDDLYLLRSDSGEVERLAVEHFPMGIGFLDELSLNDFGETTFRLGPGDVLFIGTDGITEAARDGDPLQGFYGDESLREIMIRHAADPLDRMHDALLASLHRFTSGVYHDDVAFVIVRPREGSPA